MHKEKGLPVARACKLARLSRVAYWRPGLDRGKRDGSVMEKLNSVLDIFEDPDQVWRISASWIRDCNEGRPQVALESVPPERFRALIQSTTTSTSELST